jgi:four helix bundle protein
MPLARSFRDLKVWQLSMDLAMEVFELSKRFPDVERYSLTDQIRRASRSVATNTSEAWRKRRYVAAFRSKLNDAEAEACETQTEIELALRCGYLDPETATRLDGRCEDILSMLSAMIRDANRWCEGFVI